MEWLGYGLIAAVLYGTSAVFTKVAVNKKFFGLNPQTGFIFMVAGIVLAAFFYFLGSGKFSLPQSKGGIAIAVASGLLWGGGAIMVLKALEKGADVAKLAPIYNTNTIFAVLIGIFLLGEVPNAHDSLKVIVGAVLITFGAMLLITS